MDETLDQPTVQKTGDGAYTGKIDSNKKALDLIN